MSRSSWTGLLAVGALVALVSSAASASVEKKGSWPEQDRTVTLDLEDVPRAQAVRKLAAEAGWSVVMNGPTSDKVDVTVKDQPADKVLELLLSDAAYVADRDGPRISITRADAARTEASAPPSPPEAPSAPPAPPPPSERGRDRVVSGGSLRIEKGETVHDVAVFGGSADVWGNVTGDLVVYGGSVHIHPGAHVHGDASAVGGSLTLEDGARVDGDVETLGGSFERGARAEVGGSVRQGSRRGKDDGNVSIRLDEPMSHVRGLGREISDAVAAAALLFVFGTVFIALGGSRMEQLTAEIAARPMRSFALGVVGIISSLALLVALCVIVVGIPFALIGVLLGAIALVAGLVATLTTLGTALVRHKTESPYVHLAVGCLIWLLVGAIPFVGGLAKLAAVLIGVGSLVATRAAGLVPPRKGHPYRTLSTT